MFLLKYKSTVYLAFLCLFPNNNLRAQQVVVGFYNCENFYDTINQVNVVDEEFLPSSSKGYNSRLYDSKSNNIASVIYCLGNLYKSKGIALLGVAEIENKNVLTSVLNNPLIKKFNYKFIHFDSKDIRGIDVALIYNPAVFKPYQYRPYTLTDATHFDTYSTRDILYIQGMLDSTWVHILVNHWPSRRGGEKVSSEKRIWAATVCKRIMDSVLDREPLAKFIVMGDFNDNPNNKSLKSLKLYNPFLPFFKKGLGSMAYRDSWSLFDQILLNYNWEIDLNNKDIKEFQKVELQKKEETYREKIKANELIYCKSIIYKNSSLIETEGKYQGYPKRTWNGDQYRGGYSDHFPVAIILKAKSTLLDLK